MRLKKIEMEPEIKYTEFCPEKGCGAGLILRTFANKVYKKCTSCNWGSK